MRGPQPRVLDFFPRAEQKAKTSFPTYVIPRHFAPWACECSAFAGPRRCAPGMTRPATLLLARGTRQQPEHRSFQGLRRVASLRRPLLWPVGSPFSAGSADGCLTASSQERSDPLGLVDAAHPTGGICHRVRVPASKSLSARVIATRDPQLLGHRVDRPLSLSSSLPAAAPRSPSPPVQQQPSGASTLPRSRPRGSGRARAPGPR